MLGLISCSEPEPTVHYQESVHFEVFSSGGANAQQQTNKVTEFFWYGCSHCQAFAPVLKQWLVTNKNIKAEYVPIIWNEKTELHAKIFFLLKAQPNFEAFHAEMFNFIAEFDRTTTLGEQKVALIKKLNELGIQPIDSADAIDGEVYTAELADVLQKIKIYSISGVPTVIVNEQYKVVNNSLMKTEEILTVAEYLLTL